MRVSEFIKRENFKLKRFHVSFAKMDKEHDDFHLIPTPVFAFSKLEMLVAYGIGIKLGFWGIAVCIAFPRNDVVLTERQDA